MRGGHREKETVVRERERVGHRERGGGVLGHRDIETGQIKMAAAQIEVYKKLKE